MKKTKIQLARENTENFKEKYFNGSLNKRELTDFLVNKLKINRQTARRYSTDLVKEWIVENSEHDISKFVEIKLKKHSKKDDVRDLVRLFIKDYLEGYVSRGELKSLISEEMGVSKVTVDHCITEEKKKWLKKHPDQKITRRFAKRGAYSKKGRQSGKFSIARTIAKRYMPLYHEGKLSQRSIVKMFMTGCPCVEITAWSYFEKLKGEYKEKALTSGAQVSGLCCQHCGKPPFPNTVRFQLLPPND